MKYIISVLFLIVSQMTNAASAFNIKPSAELVTPILPGLKIPDATLLTKVGVKTQLSQLLKNKPTVLVVYRGGWCPFCSRQLMGLQQLAPQLQQLGLQVLAVSPEQPQELQKNTENTLYQLLSDSDLSFSQNLGLAFYLDDKTAQIYRNKLGVNFVDFDGQEKVALPVPAVFLVDTQAMVHFQYTNPNYKVRLSNDVLLSAAKQMMQDLK